MRGRLPVRHLADKREKANAVPTIFTCNEIKRIKTTEGKNEIHLPQLRNESIFATLSVKHGVGCRKHAVQLPVICIYIPP